MMEVSPIEGGHFDHGYMLNVDGKDDAVSMFDYDGEVYEAEEACFSAVATTVPIRQVQKAQPIAINRNSIHRNSVYITIDSSSSHYTSPASSPVSTRPSWEDGTGARSSTEQSHDSASISSVSTAASPPTPPFLAVNPISTKTEYDVESCCADFKDMSLSPVLPGLDPVLEIPLQQQQPRQQENQRTRPESRVPRQGTGARLLPWESPHMTPSPFITLPILASELDDNTFISRSTSTSLSSRSSSSRRTSSSGNTSSGLISRKSIRRPFSRIIAPALSTAVTSAATAASTSFKAGNINGPARTDHKQGKYRMVRIPRDEYFRYWARDPRTGAYVGTEPEGEGLRRLRKGLALGKDGDRGNTDGDGAGNSTAQRTMSLLESRA